ncbi:histidyl-tRNA synthetase [Hyaloraphidium curvatum]|nr:histidyl-tRNA synthetase [Hyaloraphidium curvatum]
MDSREDLNARITAQGNKVRQLKSQKAEKAAIDAEVAALLALKAELQKLDLAAKAPNGAAKEEDNDEGGFQLKTPKGTKDYRPEEMALRQKIFGTIVKVFKRHGGVTIDTPVFERREILAGKYGEDSKLIYDLSDQGGELCSLRYDLTVPFARFLAMNPTSFQNIRRYHIAKVYRRDQPSVTKGRMREFFQCDFDIAGKYDTMLPDSEVLTIVVEALRELEIGSFTVKVNHRKILDGMFEVCGVPPAKFRTISSAVDKLDKTPWNEVRREMTEEKGLPEDVADKIGVFVQKKGGPELVQELLADPQLSANARAREGIEEMGLLMKYLSIFGVVDQISFDLSLARGLDYYTGLIFEAIFNNPPAGAGHDEEIVGVGSIAGGGRYDDLVGMFSGGKKIPCCGLSLGVERIYSIMLRKAQLDKIKANELQVHVIGVGDGVLEERMKICRELWDAGINASFTYKVKPKLQVQFDACDDERIPLSVIVGKNEIEKGEVKIKDMTVKDQTGSGGTTIPRSDMVSEIRARLAAK